MKIIKQIRNKIKSVDKSIAFPESDDSRVLKAASFLVEQHICSVILVGEEDDIRKKAQKEKIDLSNSIKYESMSTLDDADKLIENLFNRRRDKGISKEDAKKQLENPLYFGAGLVALGIADGCVAGSAATTAEVIKAAVHNIGLRQDTDIVSSTFLIALNDGQVLTYADCGVVPYPDSDQLADIAIESGRTHRLLTEEEPVVAMLSFSTKGSAKHERTKLVTDALERAKEKVPGLAIDGEFQFDAAFVPEVAKRKAPGSEVAGNANVFIFPNLDAGNIAYKITERLAGAGATGPILQGLAKPMMDLSRGCSWQDIVNAACVAVLMGED
jgi:phosphate acetyltransferase